MNLGENLIKINKKMVLSVTGGGTEVFSELLKHGGASEYFLEGIINYGMKSTQQLIGSEPDSYVSDLTARQLAVASYNRCVELTGDKKESHGFAATAKLKLTSREEREGRSNEIHIAYHTWNETACVSYKFNKDLTRLEQENFCKDLILHFMYHALTGVSLCWYSALEKTFRREQMMELGRVMNGEEGDGVACFPFTINIPHNDSLIFPGSFNPMHEQHLKIAKKAYELKSNVVWLELSVRNVDKPQLDFITIRERMKQISDFCEDSYFEIGGLLITNHPLYIEKSEVLPKGVTFIVGTDTYNRIGDPKYGDPVQTARKFLEKEQKLLVFGRKDVRLRYPSAIEAMSQFVSPHDYEDNGMSSSDIRRTT